ncbi:MAG: hypothetical protein R3D65_05950 [Zhengella sp.]|nr:hypothetical protein [Notoacmeibacter sp.]MCC0027674.1 hypothetical protein [Brucellaceae bacterium]
MVILPLDLAVLSDVAATGLIVNGRGQAWKVMDGQAGKPFSSSQEKMTQI